MTSTRRADSGLRKIMHTKLKAFGHCQAIETFLIAKGVPDTNICIGGFENWIECKQTDAWAVKVDAAQVAWAEQRVRNGGRVWCAVRRHGVRKRIGSYDELWFCTHEALRWLCGMGGLDNMLPRMVVGRWSGGPAGWNWQALAGILRSP